MKKVFIYSENCDRRLLDAKKLSNYFSLNNCQIVNSPRDADFIIYVSCGLFNEDVEIELQKIKHFQKFNGELIVAGCLPLIEKERLANVFNGRIIPTRDIDQIDNHFPENKLNFSSLADENICFQNSYEIGPNWITKIIKGTVWMNNLQRGIKQHILMNLIGEPAYRHLSKNNFHIRITWGCLGNCAYCGGKKAVGPLISKPSAMCVSEFRKGLNLGYSDFFLSAEDPGSYGLDIDSSFPQLLDAITLIPGNYNINIRGINPRWAVKYVDDLEHIFKRGKIGSIGVPIQSASPRILKLMNRFSNVDKIVDACQRFKKSYSDLSLNTEVILGFPSETNEDFLQTLDFISEIGFVSGGINLFSCKPDTEAENITPKVVIGDMLERIKIASRYLKKVGYKVIKLKNQYYAFYKHSI